MILPFLGISKVLPRCSSSWVIQPTQKSRRSSTVGLPVSDRGSGRKIFNLAMKNSLTFKARHQPILPQVACGFGLGMFYKSRQGSNIKQCSNQTTRSFRGWFFSPGSQCTPWAAQAAAQPRGALRLLAGDLRPRRTSGTSLLEKVPLLLELHPCLDP